MKNTLFLVILLALVLAVGATGCGASNQMSEDEFDKMLEEGEAEYDAEMAKKASEAEYGWYLDYIWEEPPREYEYTFLTGPENPVECFAFEDLDKDQKQRIRNYEAKSLYDYEDGDYDELLACAGFVFDNYRPVADVLNKDKTEDIGGSRFEYHSNPVTPQEWSDSYLYCVNFIGAYFINADGGYTNKKQSEKIMALFLDNERYASVFSDENNVSNNIPEEGEWFESSHDQMEVYAYGENSEAGEFYIYDRNEYGQKMLICWLEEMPGINGAIVTRPVFFSTTESGKTWIEPKDNPYIKWVNE
jgi:hypothetical protein